MAFLDSPVVGSFDLAVDDAFEPLRKDERANRLFYALSEAANHSLLWHGLAWGRAWIFPSRRKDAIQISIALGIESALVNGPIKMQFKRERPEFDEERPHHLRKPLTSSFPSGHASSAVVAAMLLSRKSKIGPLYWVLALLVAVSRVHVKIHHASDIVGGAVVGWSLGKIARNLLR